MSSRIKLGISKNFKTPYLVSKYIRTVRKKCKNLYFYLFNIVWKHHIVWLSFGGAFAIKLKIIKTSYM